MSPPSVKPEPSPPGPCISVTTNNVAVIANVGSGAITPASV